MQAVTHHHMTLPATLPPLRQRFQIIYEQSFTFLINSKAVYIAITTGAYVVTF